MGALIVRYVNYGKFSPLRLCVTEVSSKVECVTFGGSRILIHQYPRPHFLCHANENIQDPPIVLIRPHCQVRL